MCCCWQSLPVRMLNLRTRAEECYLPYFLNPDEELWVFSCWHRAPARHNSNHRWFQSSGRSHPENDGQLVQVLLLIWDLPRLCLALLLFLTRNTTDGSCWEGCAVSPQSPRRAGVTPASPACGCVPPPSGWCLPPSLRSSATLLSLWKTQGVVVDTDAFLNLWEKRAMKGDVNASQPCPPLSVGLLSSSEKLFRAVAGSCQEF